MSNYTIFTRTASPNDPRRRWMKQVEIKATSRPDALRKFAAERNLTPAYDIDRSTDCIEMHLSDPQDTLLGPFLAWREDKIDFDHYDFNGDLVEVSR